MAGRRYAIGVAFLLGLLWIAVIPNEPVSDQVTYVRRAATLASGAGYVDDSGNPTAYWAPGYAFFLAPIVAVLGDVRLPIHLANLAVHLLLVVGVSNLAGALYSRRVGTIAAWLTALYPGLWMWTTIYASEALSCMLLSWTLYFMVRATQELSPWRYVILAGLLNGVGCFVKPVVLVLPCAFLAVGLYRMGRWRFTLGATALITTLTVLVCVPWGLRNQRELGKFVLVSANFGANFWMGNSSNSNGGYLALPKFDSDISLLEREALLKQEALEHLWSHPEQIPKLIMQRLWITLRAETIAVHWNEIGIRASLGAQALTPLRLLTSAAWMALLLASLARAWGLIRGRVQARLANGVLGIAALLLSVPFLLIVGQDRYHYPLIPVMLVWVSPLLITWRWQAVWTRYLVVGFLVVLVDFVSYRSALGLLPTSMAKGLSFLCAASTAYLCNKYWTFRLPNACLAESQRFALVYAISFALNIGVNEAVLSMWSAELMLAFLAATAVSVVFNFIGQRYWVFVPKVSSL